MEKDFNKPKNLIDLLSLQETLDNKIKATQEKTVERNNTHIVLSLIAELIELNEELETTHKTWKRKDEFCIDKQKEEAIDVLFFFLQFLNQFWCYNDLAIGIVMEILF